MKRTILAAITGVMALALSAHGQGCVAPPSGLVSMWSAEGNANDSVGAQHGTLQNGTAFGAGKVAQAFTFDGTDDAVRVPASAALNVGAGSGLSVEFWMNPTKQTIAPLVEWNNGLGSWGVHFWQSVDTGDGGIRNLFANIRDTSGIAHQINSAAGLLMTNVFQHVALTYDKASGIAIIYHNAVAVNTQNLGVFTPQTGYDLYFGRRASGAFSTDRYKGLLDEVSLFDRALNSNEIMAIYQADSSGKCAPSPSLPLITQHPTNQTVVAGSSATFGVTATGSAPLSYQWVFNATPGSQTNIIATVFSNSFEGLPPTFDIPQGTSFLGWHVDAGNVDIVSGPAGQGFFGPSHTGTNAMDINGGISGAISTDLATQSNRTYLLSFAYTKNPGGFNGYTPTAVINIAGVPVLNLAADWANTVSELNWHTASVVFQASQPVTKLEIVSTYAGNRGIFFDTVRVDEVQVTTSPWQGTIIPNATNSTLTLANVHPTNAGNYSVIVSNVVGPVFSSNALLTVLPPPVLSNVPVIYSFTPAKAKVGEAVELVGTNFSGVAASNIVYFGPVRALVVAASPTSLTVVVPSGATFAPPKVTVAGLSAQASRSFLPTYDGSHVVNSSSFAPKVDFPATTRQTSVATGDLDGDGKPDLVVANIDASSVSVYRNITSNGVINAASFAPRVTFTSGSSPLASVADVDGDGKLDILVANNGAGGGSTISVLRNTSTPGALTSSSFAPQVNYAVGAGPVKVIASDFDGDGRPDLAVANYNSGSVSLLRNLSSPGVINAGSFAARVDFLTGSGVWDVVGADLDGDGKTDLIAANYNSGTVSILRNVASQGSLTTNSFAPKVNLVSGTTYTVAVGDLDGDGKPDLAVDNRPSSVGIFRNLSTPGNISSNSFASKVSFSVTGEPFTASIGDVDGDGKPDLAVSVASLNSVAVLRNTTSPGTINAGSFEPRVLFATGSSPRYVVVGDLDSDGRPDLTVANLLSSYVSVLKNTALTPLPPVITQQPVGRTIPIGDSVTFSVTATSAQTLTYQWLHEGSVLNGATNRLLTLPNAQLSQGGNYSVTVSNPSGSTPSSTALLTVFVPACAEPPTGLVAWWPGNNNASDSVGTNNGVLLDGATFSQGKAEQAFAFDGINDSVRIPASGSLNVGAGAAMTVEFWFNPSVMRISPLLEWNSGAGNIGMHIWHSVDTVTAGDGLGNLYANLTDINGTTHLINSASGLVATDKWQHAALTYDRVTGVAVLFLNGAAVRTQNLGIFTPQTSYDIYFGRRASGPFSSDILNGLMDEVSLYNRALSTNEIAAIYAARGTGKCLIGPTIVSVTPPGWSVNEGQTVSFAAVATGTAPLSYQWFHGGNPVASATSSSLVLSNVVFAQAGNYSVLVSNIAGTATSSNVVLDVNRAPIADASATVALVVAPLNCDGGISQATVVLDGSNSSDPDADALSYSWFQDGVSNAIATGVVAVVQLPVGSNHLTLVVSDGMASSSQTFVVEVITTDTAVERLMVVVQANADRPQPLIASLRAALASIDRCQPEVAINQLEAFKNKVLAQVAPNDPDLANLLLGEAQALIDILNGGAAQVAALEITEISQGNNGKPHLKIRGASGRVHIVETSVDMVNWVKIGVAGCNGGCDYEFNDAQTPDAGARFYRIVSPR